MITFSYPPKSSSLPIPTKTLVLRFDPYQVNWTYNVNTGVYDTYGGQVIQVLSVNIDTLTIQGNLGREGPFGISRTTTGGKDPRWGGQVPAGGFITNDESSQFDFTGTYPGLHAMVSFFREYFAVVSEGGDASQPGRFVQMPMVITYDNAPYSTAANPYTTANNQSSMWLVTPNNFPSFTRSNEAFAPEWQIEAAVVEAPHSIIISEKQAAIARLQEAIGYKDQDPWSDPLADPNTNTEDITQKIASSFRTILPAMTAGDLQNAIYQGISVPATENNGYGTTVPPSLLNPSQIMQGEVGLESTPSVDQPAVNIPNPNSDG